MDDPRIHGTIEQLVSERHLEPEFRYPFRPEIHLGSGGYGVMRRLLVSLDGSRAKAKAPDSERPSSARAGRAWIDLEVEAGEISRERPTKTGGRAR